MSNAGFVGSPAALCIGVVTSTACNLATKIKFWVSVDDALDVWAVHAIGGMCGAVMTGLFADSRVVAFDGVTEIDGGWINVSRLKRHATHTRSSCRVLSTTGFKLAIKSLASALYVPGLPPSLSSFASLS